jgi:hypothetical protein
LQFPNPNSNFQGVYVVCSLSGVFSF